MNGRADLDEARARHGEITRLLAAAQETHSKATAALVGTVQRSVKAGLNTASTPPEPPCEHRRNHRPGRMNRIDADPELRAFVLPRIEHMTFSALAKEIALNLAPARRIGRSALHAWFHENRSRSQPR